MQAKVRQVRQQRLFKQYRRGFVLLQSVVRGARSRQQISNNPRRALLLLQSIARSRFCVKQLRLKQQSCVKIQAWFRCCRMYFIYNGIKDAAIAVQSHLRRFKHRNEYRRIRKHITLIQTHYRKTVARGQFMKFKSGVVLIQAQFRGMKSREIKENNPRQTLILLQKYVRVFLAKNLLRRHKCARTIQCTYRTFDRRNKFVRFKRSIVVLEARLRCKIERKSYLNLRGGVLCLQKNARMNICRKTFAKQKGAAVALQAVFRVWEHQKRFHLLMEGVKRFQAVFRGTRSRRLFNPRKSLLAIQAISRMFVHRSRYLNSRSSAIKIQAWFRGNTTFFVYTNVRDMIVTMQSVIRRHQAIMRMTKLRSQYSILARFLRRAVTAMRRRKFRKAIVTIQARHRGRMLRKQDPWQCMIRIQTQVRGYLVRKRFYKKREELRKRAMAKIAKNTDATLRKMKLSERTARAVETLRISKKWSEIMHAMNELCLCTKYSLICCKAVLGTGSHNVIVDVICNVNRSHIHILVLEAALKTLVNISNFLDLFVHVDESFVSVLIEKLQFCPSKKVFAAAIILVERQAKNDENNFVANNQELMKRLQLINKRRQKQVDPRSYQRLENLLKKLAKVKHSNGRD